MNAQPGPVGGEGADLADLADLAARAARVEVAAGRGSAVRAWTVEGEDLRASLLVLPPGSELAPHTNREVDLIVSCVSGTGTLRVGGRDHELAPGVALYVPKGAERSVRSDPGAPVAALVVHRKTAVSSSWRWRPRRRRAWEDPWEEIEAGDADS